MTSNRNTNGPDESDKMENSQRLISTGAANVERDESHLQDVKLGRFDFAPGLLQPGHGAHVHPSCRTRAQTPEEENVNTVRHMASPVVSRQKHTPILPPLPQSSFSLLSVASSDVAPRLGNNGVQHTLRSPPSLPYVSPAQGHRHNRTQGTQMQ